MVKELTFLIFFVVFLSACNPSRMASEFANTNIFRSFTKPKPFMLPNTPDGTPNFQQGWNDGCHTGLGAYGNMMYKSAYGFKKDMNKVLDKEYNKAWGRAYTLCRWYVDKQIPGNNSPLSL